MPVSLLASKDVIHDGLAYEPVETKPFVTVAAFPVIEMPQVPDAPVPVNVGA